LPSSSPRFEAKFGHSPNPLQLSRLQKRATLATRPAKSHEGETLPQRLERWEGQLRAEIDGGLGKIAADVLAWLARSRRPSRSTSPRFSRRRSPTFRHQVVMAGE